MGFFADTNWINWDTQTKVARKYQLDQLNKYTATVSELESANSRYGHYRPTTRKGEWKSETEFKKFWSRGKAGVPYIPKGEEFYANEVMGKAFIFRVSINKSSEFLSQAASKVAAPCPPFCTMFG